LLPCPALQSPFRGNAITPIRFQFVQCRNAARDVYRRGDTLCKQIFVWRRVFYATAAKLIRFANNKQTRCLLPHAVHHDLSRTIGIIAVLTSPVDFDAQDRKPVDIVCLVIGPQGADSDHLKCVSSVARSLREAAICDQLRAAATAEELLACLGNASDVAA